jgi:ADP-dependent NAD(P)H-hydrate dehydratase / NAD(P)H-hydrate epimerase
VAQGRAVDVYGSAVVPLPTAAEAAGADAAAHDRYGVAGRVLMESAGRAAALALHEALPFRRVAVLAGSGNNGGDGCVLARALHEWGSEVTLIEGGQAFPGHLLHGIPIDVRRPSEAATVLAGADVIVDALLGTGARGTPRAGVAELIVAANAAGRPIVALDLPSGVDATTGKVHEPAITADLTISFGWPKLGLLLQPARQHCGRLVAVEIGFPPAVADDFRARALTPTWANATLPRRDPMAHKGTSGRVLLAAGSFGMGGAAIITARAAIAAGAGLVRVVTDPSNRPALHTAVPEAIVLAPEALGNDGAGDDSHALAAGPGLGTSEAGSAWLAAALNVTGDRPVVLDADALNLFAREPDELAALCAQRPVVLTPHAAELARLLGCETGDVTGDVVGAARAAADRFGGVVLVKGQPSVVAASDRPLGVGTTGSSDVATAGMGDHLTGVIVAMLAAGADAWDAAALGLFYSGRAADLAAHGRALTPTVTSRFLRRAFRDPGAMAPPPGMPFILFDQPLRW